MSTLLSELLVVGSSFGLGVCVACIFLWPWRTLALRQSAWIMAKQDMAAHMTASLKPNGLGDQPTREQRDRERVSDLYYIAMQRGEASEEEIEELRKAGCVNDGVIS